jgi:hypothetical protein
VEGEECWNGGGLRPRDRLPGGAGARARRPGNEPAGGAGGLVLACGRGRGAAPLPARAPGVRSCCAVAGGAALVAGGVRSADRPPGARSDGRERDWRVRERGVKG